MARAHRSRTARRRRRRSSPPTSGAVRRWQALGGVGGGVRAAVGGAAAEARTSFGEADIFRRRCDRGAARRDGVGRAPRAAYLFRVHFSASSLWRRHRLAGESTRRASDIGGSRRPGWPRRRFAVAESRLSPAARARARRRRRRRCDRACIAKAASGLRRVTRAIGCELARVLGSANLVPRRRSRGGALIDRARLVVLSDPPASRQADRARRAARVHSCLSGAPTSTRLDARLPASPTERRCAAAPCGSAVFFTASSILNGLRRRPLHVAEGASRAPAPPRVSSMLGRPRARILDCAGLRRFSSRRLARGWRARAIALSSVPPRSRAPRGFARAASSPPSVGRRAPSRGALARGILGLARLARSAIPRTLGALCASRSARREPAPCPPGRLVRRALGRRGPGSGIGSSPQRSPFVHVRVMARRASPASARRRGQRAARPPRARRAAGRARASRPSTGPPAHARALRAPRSLLTSAQRGARKRPEDGA